MKTVRALAACALAAGLILAGSLYAQSNTTSGYGSGPGGMIGPGMMGGPYGGGAHGPAMMGHCPGYPMGYGGPPLRAAETTRWLADVKSQVGITDAQAGVWKSFEDVVNAQAKARQEHLQAMRQLWNSPPRSALEVQEQHTKLLKQRLADQEAYTQALKDLYGVLTDEQKMRADTVLYRRR
jgi:Spy/CpxP family protein refolding chaperone